MILDRPGRSGQGRGGGNPGRRRHGCLTTVSRADRRRDALVAINAHYPGTWRIKVERLVVDDDQVATRVALTDHERGRTEVAVSFFTVRDGLIYHQEDWWPEPYDAPAWRAAWVQLME